MCEVRVYIIAEFVYIFQGMLFSLTLGDGGRIICFRPRTRIPMAIRIAPRSVCESDGNYIIDHGSSGCAKFVEIRGRFAGMDTRLT